LCNETLQEEKKNTAFYPSQRTAKTRIRRVDMTSRLFVRSGSARCQFVPPRLEEQFHGMAGQSNRRVVLVEQLAVGEHKSSVRCELLATLVAANRIRTSQPMKLCPRAVKMLTNRSYTQLKGSLQAANVFQEDRSKPSSKNSAAQMHKRALRCVKNMRTLDFSPNFTCVGHSLLNLARRRQNL
jgi:hypothetical protein